MVSGSISLANMEIEEKATIYITTALHELLEYLNCNTTLMRVDLAFKSDSGVYFYSVTNNFLRYLSGENSKPNDNLVEASVYTFSPTVKEIYKLFNNQTDDISKHMDYTLLCDPQLVGDFGENTKVYAAPIGHRGLIHSEYFDSLFIYFIREIKATIVREEMLAMMKYAQRNWFYVSRMSVARFLAIKIYGNPDESRGLKLYETLCSISSATYEKSQNHGRLGLLTEGIKEKESFIRFSQSVDIVRENVRQIRKMLEMSDPKRNFLMIEEGKITGIYAPQMGYNYSEIRFHGNGKWDFAIQKNAIIAFDSVSIIIGKIGNERTFQDSIKYVFGTDCDLIKLRKIYSEARKQPHGTIIVVTDNAMNESKRLSSAKRAIKIEPKEIETVKSITAIDGAVLIDPYGKCYAIGSILDGEAGENGSMARGARYNSAITYVDYWSKKGYKIVAVVFSEDESVDVYPQMGI